MFVCVFVCYMVPLSRYQGCRPALGAGSRRDSPDFDSQQPQEQGGAPGNNKDNYLKQSHH